MTEEKRKRGRPRKRLPEPGTESGLDTVSPINLLIARGLLEEIEAYAEHLSELKFRRVGRSEATRELLTLVLTTIPASEAGQPVALEIDAGETTRLSFNVSDALRERLNQYGEEIGERRMNRPRLSHLVIELLTMGLSAWRQLNPKE